MFSIGHRGSRIKLNLRFWANRQCDTECSAATHEQIEHPPPCLRRQCTLLLQKDRAVLTADEARLHRRY
jgi:hypothetical protein